MEVNPAGAALQSPVREILHILSSADYIQYGKLFLPRWFSITPLISGIKIDIIQYGEDVADRRAVSRIDAAISHADNPSPVDYEITPQLTAISLNSTPFPASGQEFGVLKPYFWFPGAEQ
jgi:hypothetical protein